MKKIGYGLIGLGMLLYTVAPVAAQVNFNIGFPHVSIGINLPLFPDLVPVPGYPVYYAPGVEGNYFFYDGTYWVFQDDNWYASSWYNGPWEFVAPEDVPLFVLRVPVRYYRLHPLYFRGWLIDAPPRWGQHWGREWEHNRSGWDRWERSSVPAPAPLPVYQRKYSGNQYPRQEQQLALQQKNYRYEPRESHPRQHSREKLKPTPAPNQQERQNVPANRTKRQPEALAAPNVPTSHQGGERVQRPAPVQVPQQTRGQIREERQQPVTAQHDRQPTTAKDQMQRLQNTEEPQKQKQPRAQERNKDKEEDRDRPQNK